MVSRQTLRFCTSLDGTRIAIASIGSGPPLVRTAHWPSHVEHDLASPVWHPWLAELSRHNTFIRYDQRGCGLSDSDVADFSLEAWVADLEAVVDSLELRRFPLIGMSQGGAVAIAYAVRHPEKVSHLILHGACARGTPQQCPWWNELERLTASPENAARTLEAVHQVDVTDLASRLRVPTLVLHARGDARVPFEEGRRLAALIPEARLVPLESENHVLLESEAAWTVFLAAVRSFLAVPPTAAQEGAADDAALTPAERDVLRLLARGLDNPTIALRLHKSAKTVRNQVSSIFDKLGVRTRAEAIVHVRDRAAD